MSEITYEQFKMQWYALQFQMETMRARKFKSDFFKVPNPDTLEEQNAFDRTFGDFIRGHRGYFRRLNSANRHVTEKNKAHRMEDDES